MKNLSIKTALVITTLLISQNLAFAFYDDVPKSNLHYDSIKYLYDQNLLPIEANNLFFPNEKLKNSELYRLLITYSQIPLSTETPLPFTNIDKESKYVPYLQTSLERGILKANTYNPTFDEDRNISKINALQTMFKSLGIGTNYLFDKEQFQFIDFNKNSTRAPIAQKAAELGILETPNSNLFKLTKRITKAEAADYLAKIHQYNPQATTIIIENNNSNSDYSFNKTEKKLIENPKFDDFLKTWSEIQTNYYYQDELDNDNLIQGAIKGMVNETEDIYTIYENPEDAESLLTSLSSEYEGIGTSLDMIDGNLTIVSPFKGSPAEKAGLKPNDIIIEVDGTDIINLTTSETVLLIKGEAGTSVKITVKRGKIEKSFTVKRDHIQQKTVFLETVGENIAHISLTGFNDETYKEILEIAKEVNKNTKGIILDLRYNPGGYVDVAANVIGLFSKEKIDAVKLKHLKYTETVKTNGSGLFDGIKTVVLINEGSASASEIVAGALQEYGFATIIGEVSFGKGTAQKITRFKDGSLLKITIAEWVTPEGKKIDQIGIIPDFIVENTETKDLQLEKAIRKL